MADEPTDDLPWIISVDDHVVEPPGVWQDRLSQADRAVGPRVVKDTCETRYDPATRAVQYLKGGDGPVVDWWLYEDVAKPIPKVVACAGYPFEEHTIDAIAYEDMRPGCYDPVARLDDMDHAAALRRCGRRCSIGLGRRSICDLRLDRLRDDDRTPRHDLSRAGNAVGARDLAWWHAISRRQGVERFTGGDGHHLAPDRRPGAALGRGEVDRPARPLCRRQRRLSDGRIAAAADNRSLVCRGTGEEGLARRIGAAGCPETSEDRHEGRLPQKADPERGNSVTHRSTRTLLIQTDAT